MTKDQKNIVFILIMLPVLVILILTNLGRNKAKKPGLQPQPSASLTAVDPGVRISNVSAMDKNILEAQKKRAESPWGRDPFSSDIYKSGQYSSELKLNGISYRKDNVGFAAINDEIVKKGDTINGYEVGEVLKDRVLLKKGSQSFYLTFPEE